MTDKDYLRAQRELWEPATGPNGMSRRKFLQAIGVGTGAALAAPSLLSRFEAFGADSRCKLRSATIVPEPFSFPARAK